MKKTGFSGEASGSNETSVVVIRGRSRLFWYWFGGVWSGFGGFAVVLLRCCITQTGLHTISVCTEWEWGNGVCGGFSSVQRYY